MALNFERLELKYVSICDFFLETRAKESLEMIDKLLYLQAQAQAQGSNVKDKQASQVNKVKVECIEWFHILITQVCVTES